MAGFSNKNQGAAGSGGALGGAKKASSAAKTAVKTVKRALRAVRMAWRAMHRTARLLISLGPIPIVLVVIIIVIAATAGSTAAIGNAITGFVGVGDDDVAWLKEMDQKQLKEIQDQWGPTVRQALDCSNRPPDERRPGYNCLEGLLDLGKGESPIPEEMYWMVPVWKKAAERYNLPDWYTLAAISATRTRFGLAYNCYDPSEGVGFNRQSEDAWDRYKVHAGDSALREAGLKCKEAEGKPPPEILGPYLQKFKRGQKEPDTGAEAAADYYDAVDATFTQAKILAANGAYGAKEWNYTGSPANDCITPPSDGTIYYLPKPASEVTTGFDGAIADLKKLPADLQKYNHVYPLREYWKGETTGEKLPFNVIAAIAEWAGQGNIPGITMAQVTQGESMQIPGMVGSDAAWGYGNTFGYGLWMITGSESGKSGVLNDSLITKYGGVEAMRNPIRNALAMAEIYRSSGIGAWYGTSNVTDTNAHYTGKIGTGREVALGKGSSKAPVGGGRITSNPYHGKPQTDRVSRAIAYDGQREMSACYVAAVNDWYKAIKKNPPDLTSTGDVGKGPGGTYKITGGGKFVPCPSFFPHDNSNPCYIDNRLIPDLKWIHEKFPNTYITEGYSGPLPGGGSAGCGCHAVGGDHSYGTGVDIVPNGSSDWSDINKLAEWAEPSQNNVNPPFRWVGYNGDAGHGVGNHLHLGWQHAEGPMNQPAKWVLTFTNPNGSSDPGPSGFGGGGKAGNARLVHGKAIPPKNAPPAVKQMIAAANKIRSTPYVWGGGHGSFNDNGYDCSGSVSYVLHAAGLLDSPLTSGSLASWGKSGGGKWVTVYANANHTFMTIAGLRFDTSSENAPNRWSDKMRSTVGFAVRHPKGG